jgi:hypothetical protein
VRLNVDVKYEAHKLPRDVTAKLCLIAHQVSLMARLIPDPVGDEVMELIVIAGRERSAIGPTLLRRLV